MLNLLLGTLDRHREELTDAAVEAVVGTLPPGAGPALLRSHPQVELACSSLLPSY